MNPRLATHTTLEHRLSVGVAERRNTVIKRNEHPSKQRKKAEMEETRKENLFFHSNSLEGVSYDELREGDRVSFTEANGQKGPCAENVKVI